MFSKKIISISMILLVLSTMVYACAPTQEAPSVEEPTAEPEVAPTEEVMEPVEETQAVPTELKFVIPNQTTIEQPWNTALIQALERVIAKKPHGLTITYDFAENVAEPDAERVLREYASTGNYGIVISHGVYPDALEVLVSEFPDMVWAGTGAGWTALGGNMYWMEMSIHEPAYLAGVIAGMMTESNVIGAVAAFPYPNVNGPVNAFFDGAKSVNPDLKTRMAYIESWFDPPKAKDAALAQIASGADVIYAERFGPFEACKEKGVYCIGHFLDQWELSPDTVLVSPVALWDPSIEYLIERWWEHTVDGVPYDAPMDYILFSMSEGGSNLSSYHSFEDVIPQEVKDKVAELREKIMSGELVIPLNPELVE